MSAHQTASTASGVTAGCARRSWAPRERPRLAVFRSNKHIYAQAIDDVAGRTLVERVDDGSRACAPARPRTVDAAKQVGKLVGERAKAAGIDTVVFDRGGFKYHGRVAAVADGAREAGLQL